MTNHKSQTKVRTCAPSGHPSSRKASNKLHLAPFTPGRTPKIMSFGPTVSLSLNSVFGVAVGGLRDEWSNLKGVLCSNCS